MVWSRARQNTGNCWPEEDWLARYSILSTQSKAPGKNVNRREPNKTEMGQRLGLLEFSQ